MGVTSRMTVRDRVVALVDEKLVRGRNFQLTDEDSFLGTGLADSLALVGLVEDIEYSFQVTVEPHEFNPENLDSISAMVKFLQNKGVSD